MDIWMKNFILLISRPEIAINYNLRAMETSEFSET